MDLFGEALLEAGEEQALGRLVEAGVLASAVLRGDPAVVGWASRASPEELRRLAAEGAAAQERFVRSNLRLVAHVAHREGARLGLNREELFQEGVLGLLEALRRWDHRRALRFSTYAVAWIRNVVATAAAQRCGELHVSRRSAPVLQAVRAATRELEVRGRMPSAAEVAARAGVGVRAAESWMAYVAPQPLTTEMMLTLAAPPLESEPPPVDVAGLLGELPELQRRVVRLRYGFAGPRLTQADVARRVGLSIRQVQRVEAAALAELRESCPADAWAA